MEVMSMLVSKEWLKTFIDVDADTKTLAEKITRGGIEVDDIIDYTDSIKSLVVGYVESVQKHPEADKLSVCQVNVGEHTQQIICGAPNVRQDSYVVVVLPGGRLPGGVKIKKAKLRGEESHGMICSLDELGIHSDYVPQEFSDGIFIFQNEQIPGDDALEALLLDDQVLEFDLTPNRKDALSMIGAAYEVRALFGGEVNEPEVKIDRKADGSITPVTVSNEDLEASPFYAAQSVENVTIGPSPYWMQIRLIKSGIRPINNVVDISNYVLLEYGQPLHMFDRDKIGSDTITTRYARDGEVMTTLDEKERKLQPTDIVVTNGTEPIALAGVMGGNFSEVSDATTNVIIESAVFNKVSVRKTSNRLNVRSEASSRFEKGVSHVFVLKALNRAAYLLQEYAGGTVVGDVISDGALDLEDSEIVISTEFINNRLGMDLSDEDVKESLNRLGLGVTDEGETLKIAIPSRRDDLTIKEDIIEEVARIYGYDNLKSTLPEYSKITPGRLTDSQKKTRVIRRQLNAIGFNETINYALTSDKESRQFTHRTQALGLLMPMSEERKVLRNSLVPHLLKNVTYNLNRQQKNVVLYEIGRVFEFIDAQSQPNEIDMLAGVMTGVVGQTEWLGNGTPADFYYAKGVVESVFDKLGLTEHVTYKQEELYDELHPGRTAAIYLDENFIGYIGEVHPKYAQDHDLNRTVVFEITLRDVLNIQTGTIAYEILPKYPSITRDIALVVDVEVTAHTLDEIIRKSAKKYLVDVFVFDVYEGEHVEAGKKSVAIRLKYLNREETLTDEQVEAVHTPILAALEENGALLRS